MRKLQDGIAVTWCPRGGPGTLQWKKGEGILNLGEGVLGFGDERLNKEEGNRRLSLQCGGCWLKETIVNRLSETQDLARSSWFQQAESSFSQNRPMEWRVRHGLRF